MKRLKLFAVVLSLNGVGAYGYPIWNAQSNTLEDTSIQLSMDYNALPDVYLLRTLVQGKYRSELVQMTREMDGDVMNFLGRVQSLRSLDEKVLISGVLKDLLNADEISAPNAIYIYQVMFSEEGEDIGKGYDEYAKTLKDPFKI